MQQQLPLDGEEKTVRKKKQKDEECGTMAREGGDGATRINRKRLEHLERLRKKQDEKVSRKRKKELVRIAARKKEKDTRDSLIAQLLQYQLKDPAATSGFSLVSKKDRTNPSSTTSMPKKRRRLRCVDGETSASMSRKLVKQANHYETDESSCDEGTGGEETQLATVENSGARADKAPEIPAVTAIQPAVNEKATNSPERVEEDPQRGEGTIRALDKEMTKQQRQKDFRAHLAILSRIKGASVAVVRDSEMEDQRRKLPVYAEEQPIVEAVNENAVTIICGETGSGKTTQLPQFLYEAGYTSNGHLIGVTEPRRVAAISMAARVGQEMNQPALSSYQIRFEGNRTQSTKILFMTDGVLLRELQRDATLSQFSVIIIDEAHERSIYTDVLIGLLTRICLARLKRGYPLKLVIMSATLRLEDFLQKRLFPATIPKVLNVSSRQYSVTMHFERHTPTDYLRAALRKVCQIHKSLPAGGILVFLSGQREVEQLIQWLRIKFPECSGEEHSRKDGKSRLERKKCPIGGLKKGQRKARHSDPTQGEMALIDYDEFGVEDHADYDSQQDGKKELNEIMPEELMADDECLTSSEAPPPMHCLPLYSLLPSERQQLVFQPPPDGSRLCVVATNVAETSITIPNVRYVVDTGREKRRHYDPITGVSRFAVEWVSRASADQRAGRAGRVREGHAYRLYSSAVYEDLAKFSPPDILHKPIEQLVLYLKAMNFSKLANFPFPTPPAPAHIASAEQRLIRLGALEKDNSVMPVETCITELGRTLVQIPLSPQFAKLLALSNQHGLLPYMISLVSAFSVREPIIRIVNAASMQRQQQEGIEQGTDGKNGGMEEGTASQQSMVELMKKRRKWCKFGEARDFGDLSVMLHVLCEVDCTDEVTPLLLRQLGIRTKAVGEIRRMRTQLAQILNTSESLENKLPENPRLERPPTPKQMKFLRHILTTCLPDKIAAKVHSLDPARTAGDKSGKIPNNAYKCQRLEEFVFIDSSSMLYREQPDYVLYQEIIQIGEKKCMQSGMAVEEEWLPDYVRDQFKFGA